MSDNRELLELAAKAAGLDLDYSIRNDGAAFYHTGRNALALADGGWFSSIEDDGDALRLGVQLGIQINPQGPSTRVFWPVGRSTEERHGTDKYAATRLAITRAAAEIGRQMQPHPSRVRAYLEGEQE